MSLDHGAFPILLLFSLNCLSKLPYNLIVFTLEDGSQSFRRDSFMSDVIAALMACSVASLNLGELLQFVEHINFFYPLKSHRLDILSDWLHFSAQYQFIL